MSVQAGPTGESPAPTESQPVATEQPGVASVPPAAQTEQQATPTEQQAPATEQGAWPEQIAPYQQHLEALLEPYPADPDYPEENLTPLDGLLSFYNLVAEAGADDADPQVVEQFEGWWESVGKDFGFLDDDGEPADGDEGDVPDAGDMPEWAQRMQAENQQLQQRLEQFETQGRVGEVQTQMEQQLSKLMADNGVQDDPSKPEDQQPSTRILRLAVSYGDDENAIQNAVRDYLEMTGAAQQGMINGAGQQTMSVDQLANGGAPAPSLQGGRADMEPESVQSWGDASQAALARLRGQG